MKQKKDFKIPAYIIGYSIAILIAFLTSCSTNVQSKYGKPLQGVECYHCGENVIFIDSHFNHCKKDKK
jgi:hypothetical protein